MIIIDGLLMQNYKNIAIGQGIPGNNRINGCI
jgi:hypothetical protein